MNDQSKNFISVLPKQVELKPPDSFNFQNIGIRLLQQRVEAGVGNQQLLCMVEAEESEMDLSNWDHFWRVVPWEQFDVCDGQTQFAYDFVLELLRKYECLFDTANRPIGGAKVDPFRIELLPGTKPKSR